MRIFITGGSGFIGSHITDRLLARGDDVLVIDNYATGRRDNLQPHPKLKIVDNTITNASLMRQLIKDFKPDIVVHAAASYKNPQNYEEDALTNAYGTALLTQIMKEQQINRIVYFQTALCYGLKPLEQPITLAHPILPGGSSYAISKTAGESYVELSGLDYVTFRLANAYGPRNISGPLPTFFQRLTTDKACFVTDTRRDFVYIDDMIDCIIKAIDGQGKGTYHLSSGDDFAIKELYDNTLLALGIENKPVEVKERHHDDVFSILLDPSHTNNDFNWKTKTSLKEGIQKTISYYKEHGIQETFTHLQQSSK